MAGAGDVWIICEGGNANDTVRPVFARCLILVARVVSRKHYNHFLGALILQLYLARILAPWLWGMLKMGLFVDSSQQPLLTEERVESSRGKNIIGLR
jgi:hypothetical protein